MGKVIIRNKAEGHNWRFTGKQKKTLMKLAFQSELEVKKSLKDYKIFSEYLQNDRDEESRINLINLLENIRICIGHYSKHAYRSKVELLQRFNIDLFTDRPCNGTKTNEELRKEAEMVLEATGHELTVVADEVEVVAEELREYNYLVFDNNGCFCGGYLFLTNLINDYRAREEVKEKEITEAEAVDQVEGIKNKIVFGGTYITEYKSYSRPCKKIIQKDGFGNVYYGNKFKMMNIDTLKPKEALNILKGIQWG